ncbi:MULTISPECIES: Hcp family type VI secretion system effector [Buttiauxella]|uniref:Hcp family type VI secretion system effector n=1 Tax=Buttiauxella ferragutiae ATCC 51602 TaxID=1354252 RepID=A0ABX2WDR5_9ENTR|nr:MULTISPECIES: Hcp family type VI secretion system effector [Buttiauxella]AYN27955.1 Hcp family type VI secretion system effector [Buttiauxella sp. 3AFRM03]MCE0827787.1 Hcp family type VI secretion system effector [Buttiauxella ferragutiae]OAT31651.1 Hcp family type VI secretion system effector [Buttiauxella ferragutiae ATCC 51602]
MANLIYLTLNGKNQGKISVGCMSLDSIGNKSQIAHLDQIMVYELNHRLTRISNVNHQCLTIKKPVDKSSPLLSKSINDNEILTCKFSVYRTNRFGINELYYIIKLTGAHICDLQLHIPHVVDDSKGLAEETISFVYEAISWEHCTAGTSSYSVWMDRVF